MTGRARGAALTLGTLLLAGGLLIRPFGGGFALILFGALILLTVMLERRYRRADAAPPGPEWQRTGEVFRDEEAGRWVTVWFNPATGERKYVAD